MNTKSGGFIVGAILLAVLGTWLLKDRGSRIQPHNESTAKELTTSVAVTAVQEDGQEIEVIDQLITRHKAKVLQSLGWSEGRRTAFTIEVQRELNTAPEGAWVWAGNVDDIRLDGETATIVISDFQGVNFELSGTSAQVDELIRVADELSSSNEFDFGVPLVFVAKLDDMVVGSGSQVDFELTSDTDESIGGVFDMRSPRRIGGTLLEFRTVDEEVCYLWPELLSNLAPHTDE